MTQLNLLLEFSDGTGLDETAKTIEKRFDDLEEVAEAEAKPQRMKVTGLEVAAAIGVTVLIVRGSRELVQEIRMLIEEAKKLGIKIFGIVDTNSDPTLIDFPIPANDDASKSIKLLTSYMAEVIKEGSDERRKMKEEKAATVA